MSNTLEMQVLSRKINALDRSLRSKNLVIKGLLEWYDEMPIDIETAVRATFAKTGFENVEIDVAYRLGPQRGVERPVLVKLVKEKDAKAIFSNRARLGKGSSVFIQEDMTKEDRLAWYKLREAFKSIKENESGLKASIRKGGMVVWKHGENVGYYRYDKEKKEVVKIEN
ncbi:unnamed protein product [Orchesella dallaii]|uniref:Uncharacterized protein n=1 Tax=Orchesella dallaii TaxID=48710 RepID=A0ABP1RUX2_9HEXA